MATHTLRLTWREDGWTPARVYAHVATIHNHHAERLTTMDRGEDGTWHYDVVVPEGACCSYVIAPVDDAFVADYDPASGADTHRRMRAVWSRAVRDPAADGSGMLLPPYHPGESGRILAPGGLGRPGWAEAELAEAAATGARGTAGGRDPAWRVETRTGRRVWRYEPAGMTDLLVIFDGARWARTPLPAALAALASTGRAPRLGVWAVDTDADRDAVLGRNRNFADWVVRELIQPVGLGSSHVVVAGQSLGGLAALDVAMRHPEAVGAVISLSGSFWFPEWGGELGGSVAAEVRGAGTRDGRGSGQALTARHRVFFSTGTAEGTGPDGATTMLDHACEVAHCLGETGVTVRCETPCTGHEMAAWEPALTRGLVWVYSGARGE